MKITIPLPGNWCLRNSPGDVLLLHAVGDLGIFLSYMLFALAIALFLWHRPHYRSAFMWLAAAFVFLCGLTHLASTYTLYVTPIFLLEGMLKVVTFAVSLIAAVSAPGALLRFSESMHERNNRLQESKLKEVELEKQIADLNDSIARRDQYSQQRQEHILKYQIESTQAVQRLANLQNEALSETRAVLTLAREASERVLSRDNGEQRGQE